LGLGWAPPVSRPLWPVWGVPRLSQCRLYPSQNRTTTRVTAYLLYPSRGPPLYPSRVRLEEVDSQGVGVLVVVPRASRDAEQRVAESSNGSGLPRIHTCAATSNPWRIYAANAHGRLRLDEGMLASPRCAGRRTILLAVVVRSHFNIDTSGRYSDPVYNL
jgi:hypothetical protein